MFCTGKKILKLNNMQNSTTKIGILRLNDIWTTYITQSKILVFVNFFKKYKTTLKITQNTGKNDKLCLSGKKFNSFSDTMKPT